MTVPHTPHRLDHPHPAVPGDVARRARTAQLVEAARVARSRDLHEARSDAVALITATVYAMTDVRDTILASWTTTDGFADARTWVLADEVLLTAAMLAACRHLSSGLRPEDFPMLRVPNATGVLGRTHDTAAQLVTLRVRMRAAEVDAALAEHLDPDRDPDSVRVFLRAVAQVAAACAKGEAAASGQAIEIVLARVGLAAAR